MEFADYLRFVFALVFVLGLIGVCAFAARRFGLVPGAPKAQGGATRLTVLESVAVDARRRLVLVRRDDKEHLILVSPNTEVVVERGIKAQPRPVASPEAAPLETTGLLRFALQKYAPSKKHAAAMDEKALPPLSDLTPKQGA